ncbi:MAG: choice-of-anchor D domain-containing protein [Solirubrobacterales bacterium]|nr:choice-of-anchor D domain-containing protein [Solirubrobacterales bacterium]
MARTPSTARRALRGALLALAALVALPAAASAAPSGSASVNPTQHDFGVVEVDRGYQSNGFNVQNNSDGWIDVSVRIDGPDADAFWLDWNSCAGSLSPWSSCGLGVAFGPRDGRDYTATLIVESGGEELTATLRGTGGVRELTASPQPLDFGAVEVGQTAARSVALENTGNVFFQSMVAVPVGGAVGAFRVGEDGCSMRILAPGVGCSLKILFSPYEVDNAEATIAIIGEGEPSLVKVRGTGVAAPAPAATPDEPAPATPAAPAAAPDAGDDRETAPRKRNARVAFNWRRGLPAPFRNGRVDLGIARCVAAPSCRVHVRAWFVTNGARGARDLRASRPRKARWRIVGGRRAVVRIPRGLRGTPKRLIVDLRSKATGQAVGRQRLNVPLIEGFRRRGAVIASPTGR